MVGMMALTWWWWWLVVLTVTPLRLEGLRMSAVADATTHPWQALCNDRFDGSLRHAPMSMGRSFFLFVALADTERTLVRFGKTRTVTRVTTDDAETQDRPDVSVMTRRVPSFQGSRADVNGTVMSSRQGHDQRSKEQELHMVIMLKQFEEATLSSAYLSFPFVVPASEEHAEQTTGGEKRKKTTLSPRAPSPSDADIGWCHRLDISEAASAVPVCPSVRWPPAVNVFPSVDPFPPLQRAGTDVLLPSSFSRVVQRLRSKAWGNVDGYVYHVLTGLRSVLFSLYRAALWFWTGDLNYLGLPPPPPVDLPSLSPELRRRLVPGRPFPEAMKHRYDFAAYDSGARIVDASPVVQNVRAVQRTDSDSYMLVPCDQPAWFVIALNAQIYLRAIALVSQESYSSTFRLIQVLGSDTYPTPHWRLLAVLSANFDKSKEWFNVETSCRKLKSPSCWVRFLKIQVLETYSIGRYGYCTLNRLQVFGSDVLESLDTKLKGATDDLDQHEFIDFSSEYQVGENKGAPPVEAILVEEEEHNDNEEHVTAAPITTVSFVKTPVVQRNDTTTTTLAPSMVVRSYLSSPSPESLVEYFAAHQRLLQQWTERIRYDRRSDSFGGEEPTILLTRKPYDDSKGKENGGKVNNGDDIKNENNNGNREAGPTPDLVRESTSVILENVGNLAADTALNSSFEQENGGDFLSRNNESVGSAFKTANEAVVFPKPIALPPNMPSGTSNGVPGRSSGPSLLSLVDRVAALEELTLQLANTTNDLLSAYRHLFLYQEKLLAAEAHRLQNAEASLGQSLEVFRAETERLARQNNALHLWGTLTFRELCKDHPIADHTTAAVAVWPSALTRAALCSTLGHEISLDQWAPGKLDVRNDKEILEARAALSDVLLTFQQRTFLGTLVRFARLVFGWLLYLALGLVRAVQTSWTFLDVVLRLAIEALQACQAITRVSLFQYARRSRSGSTDDDTFVGSEVAELVLYITLVFLRTFLFVLSSTLRLLHCLHRAAGAAFYTLQSSFFFDGLPPWLEVPFMRCLGGVIALLSEVSIDRIILFFLVIVTGRLVAMMRGIDRSSSSYQAPRGQKRGRRRTASGGSLSLSHQADEDHGDRGTLQRNDSTSALVRHDDDGVKRRRISEGSSHAALSWCDASHSNSNLLKWLNSRSLLRPPRLSTDQQEIPSHPCDSVSSASAGVDESSIPAPFHTPTLSHRKVVVGSAVCTDPSLGTLPAEAQESPLLLAVEQGPSLPSPKLLPDDATFPRSLDSVLPVTSYQSLPETSAAADPPPMTTSPDAATEHPSFPCPELPSNPRLGRPLNLSVHSPQSRRKKYALPFQRHVERTGRKRRAAQKQQQPPVSSMSTVSLTSALPHQSSHCQEKYGSSLSATSSLATHSLGQRVRHPDDPSSSTSLTPTSETGKSGAASLSNPDEWTVVVRRRK